MMATINLNELGLLVVALFVVTCLVALLIWGLAGIKERWAIAQSRDQRR